MRRIKLVATRQALRFTRWSRCSAAAFHSVGNVVHIGVLRANVQEQIAPKSSNALLLLHSGWQEVLSDEQATDAYDTSGFDPWELLRSEAHLPLSTTDNSYAQPS